MNDEFAEDFNESEEQEIKQEVIKEIIPARTDSNWSDYLMAQLTPSEIYIQKDDKKGTKYPKVAGLRRLTLAYLGTIINSGIKNFVPPAISYVNGSLIQQFAVVVYEIVVLTHDKQTLTYSEIADAHPLYNLDSFVAGHPSPMAATRAEARALRKILGLTVAAAEEIQGSGKNVVEMLNNKETKDEESNQDMIQKDQIVVIEKMCRKLNIDIKKLITGYLIDLSREEAQDLCKKLAMWDKNKNTPVELLKT